MKCRTKGCRAKYCREDGCALDKNQQAFFELLRAGLWGDQGSVQVFKSSMVQDSVDWEKVYQLAQEQSVLGVVLQGIEELRAKNIELSVPKVLLLQWIGEVQVIEQQNKAMNAFIADLIEKLRKENIYAILVKGQGIAQCYERPLWRACGDVDLFLSESNYKKAIALLPALASSVEEDRPETKHLAMTIDGWVVELHGTLRSQLGKRIDIEIDEVQDDTFFNGKVRAWQNGEETIFLPSPDNDVVFVFCHILQHFFRGGIGLRQICDWCRLLWTYKESLNYRLLELRIRKMGLMSEWKAFYNMANRYLGMPDYGSGLMVHDSRYDKKADRIMGFVLETGNFGHNRDNSYYKKYPYFVYKAISVWKHTKDSLRHFFLFPDVAAREWWRMIKYGFHVVAEGK